MNEEGERLRQFLESKGISIRKFCIENDISYNSFHQIITGGRKIGLNTLKQVAKAYPNLNMNWVIFGKGPIEIDYSAGGLLFSNEPFPTYGEKDAGFQLFLKYLEYPESIEKILNIIKKATSNHGK